MLDEITINGIIEKYGKNINYPDQDLLNCCFVKNNECILLPLRYNVLPPYFIENPAIVHFTGSFCYSRPWTKNCQHPYAHKFREISDKFNSENNIYPDDRNCRQKVQSFFIKRLPNKIIIPLVCGVKRFYEKD